MSGLGDGNNFRDEGNVWSTSDRSIPGRNSVAGMLEHSLFSYQLKEDSCMMEGGAP